MDEDRKPFDRPVTIDVGGAHIVIEDTVAARDLLASTDWPGARGEAHRRALDACLKVLDGHRSTEDGRQRLVEATLAAGIYAGTLK